MVTVVLYRVENIVGNGENAGNQHFLLFPQCFLPFPKANFNFSAKFHLLSASAFKLDLSKNLLFGKELRVRNESIFHYLPGIPPSNSVK